MKVIDKRTKKNNENYKYGDILMCWEDNPDEYDLLRISVFYDVLTAEDNWHCPLCGASAGHLAVYMFDEKKLRKD